MWALGALGRPKFSVNANVLLRRFKSDKILILNPQESGILPRRRRKRVQKQVPNAHSALIAEVNLMARQLQSEQEQLRANEHTEETSKADATDHLDKVVEQLRSQEPRIKEVSTQRYRQLSHDLTRGFTKQQLHYYLNTCGQSVASSARKPRLLAKILDDVWRLKRTKPIGDDIVVEKVMELSDRTMFLILGKSGALIRSWTKAGAKVFLIPGKQQLLVRATAETYDWIVASLHHMEENLEIDHFSLSEFTKLVPLNWHMLNLVQRLSEAYFVLENGIDSREIVIYARDRANIALARRLLTQFVPKTNRESSAYLYDTTPENLSRCGFSEFTDHDALGWKERALPWSRWEAIRTRHAQPEMVYQLGELQPATFGNSEPKSGKPVQMLAEEVESAVEQSPGGGPLTVTATLGFLLHQNQSNNTMLPNVGMSKAFTSDIPFVAKLASELSYNELDIQQEATPSMQDLVMNAQPDTLASETSSTPATSDPDALWDQVLNGIDSEPVYANKRSDVGKNKTIKLIQLEFTPCPFDATEDGSNLTLAYPRVELWAELQAWQDRPKLDISTSRLVSVPQDMNVYASLPAHASDLKLNISTTNELPLTAAVKKFLASVSLSSNGPVWVPSELEIEIDGKPVKYMYSASAYRTQIDLNYSGTLLQLSMIEGGRLGGRRLEANLVSYNEGGKDELLENPETIPEFVGSSVRLVNDLEPFSVALAAVPSIAK